ncbi:MULTISPECIES: hypothetical protein [Pseudomonadaceae]|uniref:Uncharacterized protein n=1 Tax=Ectopseudomonas oleovorans TaxID=301 RepID=A0AA42QAN8_ECTOL|nr:MULTISPECIES: hypothetical protein [Pseudomonas]MDH1340287.1 hypothetical protein [Pseudomonas oleovorans]MDH1494039.1 hypothetical protein [Pseudomonas oleovorans]WGG22141.1 hypothetical protein N5O83_05520 [Pseudomonas oleovorans]
MPEIALDENYNPDLDLSYAFAHMLFPRSKDEKLRKLYLAHEILNERLNPYKYSSNYTTIPKELIKIVTGHGKLQNNLVNITNCEHGASVGRIFLSLLRIHASDIPLCITGSRALAASQIAVATNSFGKKAHSFSVETLQASTRQYKKSAHLWASLVILLDEEAEATNDKDYERVDKIFSNFPKLFIGTAETLAQLYQDIPRAQKHLLPFNEEEFWRYPLVDQAFLGIFLPDNLSPEEAGIVHDARARNPSNSKTTLKRTSPR